MKKYRSILFIVFFAAGYSSARAQTDDVSIKTLTAKLDKLMEEKYTSPGPGCAVLVAKQGKILYNKAFGSADLELNVPLQPGMVFKLGSITKQFTAVAILQLVEQGKISLQDSLQKYIRDFPSKGYTITIENLLTHTSGIKDYMQIDYPEPYLERRDFTPPQLIDSFKNVPLEFEPGTKFSYSNSGYFLLGYIIEKIAGKAYPDYIRENILRPPGLSHTYLDSSNIIIPNRVNGYKKETLDKAFTPFKLKDGTLTGPNHLRLRLS
jgi:CubicO group peptidase (beta-lactamase class C family)